MFLDVGSVIAARYRLEKPLARGGMGSVWRAHDLQLDAPVAVKLMAPALAASADARARFEREAKAAAQLRSANVVGVFGHGVHEGTPYMVLELLEGEDLGARLRRQKALGLAETSRVLAAVTKALRRAHEAGIVHRDLKPANIFLARSDDDDEVVKVLDFGIAKAAPSATGGESTRTGVVMGSPTYMSPEQVRSAKGVDHRSDLWSLALVLFRMLTGRAAFVGETDADILVRICADPIPVPSQVAPGLSPAIDAFFARALQRDPARRFQSAREMAEAFDVAAGFGSGRAPAWVQPPSSSPVPARLVEAPGERTLPLEVMSPPTYHPTAPLVGDPHALGLVGPEAAPSQTAPEPGAIAGSAIGHPLRSESTFTNASSAVQPKKERSSRSWVVLLAALLAFAMFALGTTFLLRTAPEGVAAAPVVGASSSSPIVVAPPSPEPAGSVPDSEPTTQPSATVAPKPSAKSPTPKPLAQPVSKGTTTRATAPTPTAPEAAMSPFKTRVDPPPAEKP